ncbi:MAG: protein kinase [Actinomycetota bacterium]|nr:protein kinase [Actinomycetota bacterium]
MSRRPPAPPPTLPGYAVSKLLGSGGFADVYLYDQQLPRRSVAVKVLVPGLADGELLEQFDAEANLMAALSTHPAIVTIHQAGISAEGRPYLVMEYCSRPNLSARYRAERIGVPEVLRVGVRLAGAVETAHRAGILHRDIKPANVLTTDFGHAVLSDFGISVQSTTARAQSLGGASVGMSIPWTAPEVLAQEVGGDERADVYSLAATLYTVLARRSPFDRPGGSNSSADLIGRIRSAPLPPLGRSDLPAGLERALARAMDKNRAARYATALDFGRALQQIEGELRLAPTPIDVLDEHLATADEELRDTPATRIRALTVIEPEALQAKGFAPPLPGGLAGPPPMEIPRYQLPTGQQRGKQLPRSPRGWHGQALPAGNSAGPAPQTAGSQRRSPVPLLVAGSLFAVAVALVTVLIATRGAGSGPQPVQQGTGLPSGSHLAAVPPPPSAVQDLAVTVSDGKAMFSWHNPNTDAGLYYQWKRTDAAAGEDSKVHNTDASTITIPAASACIQVRVINQSGQPSDPADKCTPE